MKVKRVVANVAADDVARAKAFYADFLGLDLVMDLGWIATYAADSVMMSPQVNILSEGGAGAPVPDLSIEVDDLNEALRRARACGLAIEYGPAAEPWGVRRFFVRDPFGCLINVLVHV
jgi:catechol 2,3-dioxygenase-like lactoylglutathione lyase family enzyme